MSTAAAAGAVTMNTMSGKVKIAAGQSSVVVTNQLVGPNSIVLPVLMSNDATATSIKSVVVGSGTFTITVNANTTAVTTVGFVVLGSTE
jgi:hypothetical protein